VTQIAFILLHAELDKDFRETEAWFNDSRAIREELNIDKSPDHTTLCRWEQQVDMRELRSLLRRSAEQAGWSGTAAIDASGFQRDQTSYHYRNRAGFSFHKLKTTILVDTESLAIKDVHFTTKRKWDGHRLAGLSAQRRRPARVPCRCELFVVRSQRGVSHWRDTTANQTQEHNALKKAHNARMDEDLYHQRTLSETAFSLLKDDGESYALGAGTASSESSRASVSCITYRRRRVRARRLLSFSGRIRQRHRRHPRTGSHKVT